MYQIYNADCLEKMKEIEDSSIDLILTDPPYLISKKSGYVNNSIDKIDYIKKYGKHSIDFGDWDKVELNLISILSEFKRILKPSGTLIMFYDVWKMQEVKEIAEEIGLKQPRLCMWEKTNPVPINSKLNYLTNAHEYFCTFVKKSKPTFHSEYDFGIYKYPICHGKERTIHPTQKPVKLIQELILKHSNENDLVLDNCMESGSTGVACLNTNRDFIGIEKELNYFNIAKERLENVRIK